MQSGGAGRETEGNMDMRFFESLVILEASLPQSLEQLSLMASGQYRGCSRRVHTVNTYMCQAQFLWVPLLNSTHSPTRHLSCYPHLRVAQFTVAQRARVTCPASHCLNVNSI